MYVPTAGVVGWALGKSKPFALPDAASFRPPPPVPLTSAAWVADYNEVKTLGARTSSARTPLQTEQARFWLMVGAPAYHPVARQIAIARQMDVAESARFMALYATALADAYIAVFEAKYHYAFWRPVTAVRNDEPDRGPETPSDPGWQPLDATPLHPEYPCAHCVESGAAAAIVSAALGSSDIPEVALTSTTMPGVTYRWTNMDAFASDVSQARIYAGFHYRFSTRVGTEMGKAVGAYVASQILQRLEGAREGTVPGQSEVTLDSPADVGRR